MEKINQSIFHLKISKNMLAMATIGDVTKGPEDQIYLFGLETGSLTGVFPVYHEGSTQCCSTLVEMWRMWIYRSLFCWKNTQSSPFKFRFSWRVSPWLPVHSAIVTLQPYSHWGMWHFSTCALLHFYISSFFCLQQAVHEFKRACRCTPAEELCS